MPQHVRIDLYQARNALHLLDRAIQDFDQQHPYAAPNETEGLQRREQRLRLITLRRTLLKYSTDGIENMLEQWQEAAMQEP